MCRVPSRRPIPSGRRGERRYPRACGTSARIGTSQSWPARRGAAWRPDRLESPACGVRIRGRFSWELVECSGRLNASTLSRRQRSAQTSAMKTTRLEAFSDGVIAILITIMVLELKVPHDATFGALREMIPVLLSYVLSFIFLGIYWNNHHHVFAATAHVSGAMMWANLHLLFWLSLVPFVTAWMGENSYATAPTAAYGVV